MAVVGAGVVGMAQAITLAEMGYKVTIYSDAQKSSALQLYDGFIRIMHSLSIPIPNRFNEAMLDLMLKPKPGMASIAASGIFQPYALIRKEDEPLNGGERERLEKVWTELTETSYKRFKSLLSENCGVEEIRHTEVLEAREQMPFYANVMKDFRETTTRAPDGSVKPAWEFTTFGVEMGRYLAYLHRRFAELGGRIVIKHLTPAALSSLPEPVIFNCTGAGARELRHDNEMRVAKGLTLLLKPAKGAQPVSIGDGDFDIVSLPGARVKLGCGYTEQKTDTTEPDKADYAMILGKASSQAHTEWARFNGLAGTLREVKARGSAAVSKAITGVFATKKRGPRIEASVSDHGKVIVDNYAHGYCGMTLSWGAAEAAVREWLRIDASACPAAS